jgi:hypothetical protein
MIIWRVSTCDATGTAVKPEKAMQSGHDAYKHMTVREEKNCF